MNQCLTCSTDVPETSRFCPNCGAAVGSRAPTLVGSRQPGSSDGSPTPASGSFDEGRFIPGTLLADRYRIVGLIGRGGMGEIYRANDLKLGQSVALKFLPPQLTSDPSMLARFHGEVRVARQVSHPNVCRVHDIGEVEGQQFISMEYVDGEDLASLLRRIGRLPSDKAVEMARQMCAGLAAAHDKEVLHRDIKPANIMIDGRGKVLITDFGLAGWAEQIRGQEVRVGTPAYMAPEQLTGREVSVQSDLFSLGLVLYELFVGRPAFSVKNQTLAEIVRMREEGIAPADTPSRIVEDLDPIVEQVILRCLESDPRQRPASALAVASALPGADPLAAALAAGETPSPEMVAAAGETGTIRPAVGWACLGGIVVGLLLWLFLSMQTSTALLFRQFSAEHPPQVLEGKAREIIRQLGYTEPPVDTAGGFRADADYLRYIENEDQSPGRWEELPEGRPPVLLFWYRQSPRYLEPESFGAGIGGGVVRLNDPPNDLSGMISLQLDSRGRLVEFHAVPPQVEEPSPSPAGQPDWQALFAAAGLDPEGFTPAEPRWLPPQWGDQRTAWEGAWPEQPQIPLRIEAASYRGQPVYFELVNPWTRPRRLQAYQAASGEKIAQYVALFIFLALLTGGGLLARHNLRLGRGDRRGATRLATWTFALVLLAWLLAGTHVPNFSELWLFIMAVAWGLFVAVLLWVLYVALEPYVRRRWPDSLISWSRVLAGRFRDPLVGRDLLVASLFSISILLVNPLEAVLRKALGMTIPVPLPGNLDAFASIRDGAGIVVTNLAVSIFIALAVLFLLFLFRVLMRKEWAAVTAVVVIFSIPGIVQSDVPLIAAVQNLLAWGMILLLLVRYGLLALAGFIFLAGLIGNWGVTGDFTGWYAGFPIFALLAFMAIALFAFRTALGSQPLFRGQFLKE